jgi:hypothetical protein
MEGFLPVVKNTIYRALPALPVVKIGICRASGLLPVVKYCLFFNNTLFINMLIKKRRNRVIFS